MQLIKPNSSLGSSNGKESTCPCRRHRRPGFDPWVGKIPWRRVWQPTPAFLPGKSLDRGAWWAPVHGVRKSWTQLNTHLPAQLIQNVVLVLGVQESEPVIHTHIYLLSDYFSFQVITKYWVQFDSYCSIQTLTSTCRLAGHHFEASRGHRWSPLQRPQESQPDPSSLQLPSSQRHDGHQFIWQPAWGQHLRVNTGKQSRYCLSQTQNTNILYI